jgi:phosphatidate cytidylyltransferase
VKCFTGFGHALSLGYSVALAACFLRPQANPALGLEAPATLDAAAVAAAAIGAFCLQLRRPIRGLEPLQAVAANLLGFVYIPFLFGFAARLVFLVPGSGQVPGALLLLWLIAVTKFTDMGAYLTGSLIGKHKMIPHVSPGKTWEGFGGALAFAQLAGCGLFALFPNQLAILGGWPHVIVLGVILALLSVVGDLAESILKRSLGAKDSGRMLPGIGGALDLIDSLCFTAPALYFYLKWAQP